MSKGLFNVSVVLALALASSALAHIMLPTQMMADERQPAILLASLVPESFGGWRMLRNADQLVVDPQVQATIQKLYSQTLSRTYVNRDGERVMLSIAYGRDQRDQLQAHHPEVCYPAQGFQLLSNRIGALHTSQGSLPVRRLETALSLQRPEPVTYWLVMADTVTLGGVEKKLKEMRLGLRGLVPDGLLFRVSSIDADSAHAFAVQDQFVNDLLNSLPSDSRRMLAGTY